jgi:PAS domain S-box-containing protein
MLDGEGIIRSWTMAAEQITGYSEDEVLGEYVGFLFPEEDVQKGKAEKELETARQQGVFRERDWRKRKDGAYFWANVVVTALRDENDELQGYAKVIRDETTRKRAEDMVQAQAQEISELSTPVMQVWDGIVVAPLVGALDSHRTQQLMEMLLTRVVETNSPVALVDITGVPTIDTRTAQHLLETIAATRLLGAQVILTGVRPAIAQTIVHLGIDMQEVITRSSLAAGLRVALGLLGLEVIPGKSAAEQQCEE